MFLISAGRPEMQDGKDTKKHKAQTPALEHTGAPALGVRRACVRRPKPASDAPVSDARHPCVRRACVRRPGLASDSFVSDV